MSEVLKDLEDLQSSSDPVLKKACFSVKTKLKVPCRIICNFKSCYIG
jgi:hypothetical protein